jgi:hypothetical protein
MSVDDELGRRELALLGVVFVVSGLGAALFAYGAVWVAGVDAGPGGQALGGANVTFSPVADQCGLDYRTTGNADGSDDGGVAVADYDRDGWPDLLAVGGGPTLFENTGEGFDRSGALPEGSYPPVKSALFFDAEGDGYQDLLLVPRSGEPVFLDNDNGTFRRTDEFGTPLRWGTGATAADFDGDGDRDVVIVQNGDWRNGTPRRGASGEATDGFDNLLFEHTEEGFERVDSEAVAGSRWSLAVASADLTGDGRPDVYVANDYGRDALLVNRGGMAFERRPVPETNFHGMASVLRDVDGDGLLDVFVTNIQFENPQAVWELDSGLNVRNRGNSLLLNAGNGTFEERAAERGLKQGGWGWAAAIEDFDNDGTLDVLHATKHYLTRSDDGGFDGVATRPSLWDGRPNGTFERRDAAAAGLETSNGRGLATLDFDRDGDRDVVVADTSEKFALYENRAEGDWLQVRVRGPDALGTRVTVETDRRTITRVQHARSNFFSQSSRTLQFGLGPDTVESVRVERPDGTGQTIENVEPNRRLIVHGNGTVSSEAARDSGC